MEVADSVGKDTIAVPWNAVKHYARQASLAEGVPSCCYVTCVASCKAACAMACKAVFVQGTFAHGLAGKLYSVS